jgi:phosphoserine phosphatase
MVVFDLDGTLTPVISLWRHLHEAFGTWEKGEAAARKYRQGEITYKEWAETDAGYWVGTPLAELTRVLESVPYRTGTRKVFEALREKGVRTVILSAGLSILADKAARELGADIALSNELQTHNGSLTGEIKVKVVVNDKQRLIKQIAADLGIPLAEVALVGDRANDLPISECLRIAFRPRDQVARQEADFVIEDDDLSTILQYLV